jgi:hypothetical protein
MMDEVERFESSTGNVISLRSDGTRWEVVNCTPDGKIVWTETSISGAEPFTEEEARTEFARWSV